MYDLGTVSLVSPPPPLDHKCTDLAGNDFKKNRLGENIFFSTKLLMSIILWALIDDMPSLVHLMAQH